MNHLPARTTPPQDHTTPTAVPAGWPGQLLAGLGHHTTTGDVHVHLHLHQAPHPTAPVVHTTPHQWDTTRAYHDPAPQYVTVRPVADDGFEPTPLGWWTRYWPRVVLGALGVGVGCGVVWVVFALVNAVVAVLPALAATGLIVLLLLLLLGSGGGRGGTFSGTVSGTWR